MSKHRKDVLVLTQETIDNIGKRKLFDLCLSCQERAAAQDSLLCSICHYNL